MSVTTAVEIDDGLTDAERNYFQTGGDVNEALVKETATPEPAAEPPPAAPSEPAVAAPSESPAVAADDDEDDDVAAAPAATDPAQAPRKQRVSLRKFQAAEEARQKAEAQLQEQAVRNARIEERLSLLQQALQEPAAEQTQAEPQRPDPEQDIFGYARYLEDQLNAVATKVNGYEQQISAGQAEMEAERRYFDSLNSFGATKPDFIPAYNFLLRSRAAELIERDPRFTGVTDEQLQGIVNGTIRIPGQISDALRSEERDLYRTAFESNRDPAATIYRYATVRGYRPPAPQPVNGAAAVERTGGVAPPVAPGAPGTPLGGTPRVAAAPPVPAARQQPTATEVVQSIQNGQRAALSLSQAGGSAGGGELTPDMLANMSQEQFETVYNELLATGNSSKLKDLMGH